VKIWLRTSLAAAAGGAISAGCAEVLDPDRFNLRFGQGRLALMMLEGALIAIGALVVGRMTNAK
jgi:hypothetical protein